MIKEIEVKAKIFDKDKLLAKIQNLVGVLSEPIRQVDRVFLPLGCSLDDKLKGISVLRIRKNNDKILFTLKQSQANDLACLERELEISDEKIMLEIIELLNFYKVVEVNKMRRKCRYNDYEICLDQVEGLGDFIEVEKMTDQDVVQTQEELFTFLESLGVKREDRVLHGYDVLMFNKKNEK